MNRRTVTVAAVLSLLILSAVSSYYVFRVYLPGKRNAEFEEKTEIKRAVWRLVIEDILIEPLLMTSEKKGQVPEYTARMPLRYTPDDIRNLFGAVVSGYDNTTMEYEKQDSITSKIFAARVRYKGRDIFRITFTRNNKPKIAIILDDWGYNNRNFDAIEAIDLPFTGAVLPGHVYSGKAAKKLRENKKAVIVHLPMQSKTSLPPEKETLRTDMTSDEIREMCLRLLLGIPGAYGVNNHQGSLATEDAAVMDTVLNVIKDRGMYYIDSRTSRNTIGLDLAREKGVLSAWRNIFIDNEKYLDYIQQQFLQLKRVAKRKGFAIGIGHDNETTMQALEMFLPALETEGYEMVYVAELVQ